MIERTVLIDIKKIRSKLAFEEIELPELPILLEFEEEADDVPIDCLDNFLHDTKEGLLLLTP